MELDTDTRIPIGFYRKEYIGRIPVVKTRATFFVSIKDEAARNLAQSATLSVWTKLLEGASLGQAPVSHERDIAL